MELSPARGSPTERGSAGGQRSPAGPRELRVPTDSEARKDGAHTAARGGLGAPKGARPGPARRAGSSSARPGRGAAAAHRSPPCAGASRAGREACEGRPPPDAGTGQWSGMKLPQPQLPSARPGCPHTPLPAPGPDPPRLGGAPGGAPVPSPPGRDLPRISCRGSRRGSRSPAG